MNSSKFPAVDVVVPCYNREETVKKSIQSVLDQDYQSIKLYAVDDNSEDDTFDVLSRIEDDRVSVSQNGGVKGAAGARNWGSAQGTADFIAFQDSDDLWLPGKLTLQMQRLLSDASFVACYCSMACYEDGRVFGRIPNNLSRCFEGEILKQLLHHSFVSTQTLVIRRSVFEQIGGMDPSFRALDDWEMMLRVSQEGPIACVGDVLVEQHMSSNSITRSSPARLQAQQQILEKHRATFEKYPRELAFHHNRISGALRQVGAYKEALAHAQQAARICPFDLRYLAKYNMLKFLA